MIQIGEVGQNISYTYRPLEDTKNDQTLESMGKGGQSFDYSHYFEYSGAYDYANQVTMAAFQGSKTAFPNTKVNFDFGKLGMEGRAGTFHCDSATIRIIYFPS